VSTNRVITEAKLQELWRVAYTSMYAWRTSGLIQSDEREVLAPGPPSHLYTLRSVQQWHERWGRNFTDELPLPSVASLLAGRDDGTPALLTTHETANILGISRDTLQRAVHNGSLPAIIMPGGNQLFRYPAATVHSYLRKQQKQAVHIKTACRLLCLNERHVRALPLERVNVIGANNWIYFTRKSIEEMLHSLLVNITLDKWWGLAGAPLFTVDEVARARRVHPKKIATWMEEDKPPYIKTPSGRYRRIPDWAVQKMFERRRPLSVEELMRIIPTPERRLAWLASHYMLCADHEYPRSRRTCVSMVCLEAYITAHRTTTDFTATDWLTRCLKDGALPVSAEELVAETVGTDMSDIETGLATGALRGLYMPPLAHSQPVLIMRSDAIAWRRWRERQLRNAYE
jgi:excisionase family DNA binding protein